MEKETFRRLACAAGAIVGFITYNAIQAGPFDFDALAIAGIVAGAVGLVLVKVPPRICDKIGKGFPAEEE